MADKDVERGELCKDNTKKPKIFGKASLKVKLSVESSSSKKESLKKTWSLDNDRNPVRKSSIIKQFSNNLEEAAKRKVELCKQLSKQQVAKTLSKPMIKQASLFSQFTAGFAVAFGSAVIGFSGAFTSPALPQMKESYNSTLWSPLIIDEYRLVITDEEGSWIGSLMPMSAMFGGLVGGTLIEKLGRKTTIIGTAIPFFISYLLLAFAQDVLMLYAGRSINGACIGILSLATPVFISEVIQPKIRGTMGVLPATFGNSAILLCYLAGMMMDWRCLALIGASLPIPFFFLMLFVPETPRWFLAKGNKKNAYQALKRLRGKHADLQGELNEMEQNITEANKNVGTLRDMFNRAYIKSMIICIGLMLFQQLSGINAVIFYTVQIFQLAGSTINENISACIVGGVNIAATLITTLLIDMLGRKVLLLLSGFIMALTLLGLGVYFHLKHTYGQDYVTPFSWLPLACLVIYVVGFSLGFGPIPWLMMGEVFPNKIRGIAASIATAFNWTSTFLVTKTFHGLLSSLGVFGTFYLYGCICVLSIVFIIFLVPETKGKSLEEIEKVLGGKPRPT